MRTRMALIDPLLSALGWTLSDPKEVIPEYKVDGGWADYALGGRIVRRATIDPRGDTQRSDLQLTVTPGN